MKVHCAECGRQFYVVNDGEFLDDVCPDCTNNYDYYDEDENEDLNYRSDDYWDNDDKLKIKHWY